MFDTMTRYLESLSPSWLRWDLRKIFLPLVDRYSSQPLTSAGLAITSGGATTAKIGANDFYASVKGILVKIAAATNMPALTGLNIAAGAFNVICFFTDSAGNVTASMGVAGAAVGNVVFPTFPEGQSLIGFLIITYASAFTGGTTPLDTATTVYVSPLGAFDPSVLV